MVALDLAHNGLHGRLASLPIKHLHSLRSLNLAGNQLHGPIPPDIGYLHDLRFVALDGNRLTSYIPGDLAKLVNLEWLSLK